MHSKQWAAKGWASNHVAVQEVETLAFLKGPWVNREDFSNKIWEEWYRVITIILWVNKGCNSSKTII